jgi:hypothetical protein
MNAMSKDGIETLLSIQSEDDNFVSLIGEYWSIGMLYVCNQVDLTFNPQLTWPID